jgi:DNA-binding response OmpR family regulator
MPYMNGVQLMDWIRRERPELSSRVVMMTGDVSDSTLNAAVESANLPILQKPFTVDRLLDVVCATLERADGAR